MLSTPSLWEKLIYIDSVSAKGVEWWNELVRRTGTALLRIRVEDGLWERRIDPTEHTKNFFFDILHKNWNRTQILVMNLSISYASQLRGPLEILRLPAPVLETFDVTFDCMGPVTVPDYYTLISPPFSGYAPMLRRFKFPLSIINEHVPWLNHLHSIELNGVYSVRLTLAILSSTPCLQELKIGHLRPLEDISTPIPTASLANLKFLEYTGHPREGATLLDHIEIPSDCSIHVAHPYEELSYDSTAEQCHSIITTYFRYAQRRLRSLLPGVITLNINAPHGIIVKIAAKSEIPADDLLRVSIPLRKRGNSRVPFTILETLDLPEFSCLTKLKLRYVGNASPVAIGKFLGFFTSLRTIKASGETFRSLTALQNDMNAAKKQIVLFPLLEAIELNGYPGSFGSLPTNQAAMFILSRAQNGHRISTLHLPYYTRLFAQDLDKLVKAQGLQVLYK